jgi:hypothetical protein
LNFLQIVTGKRLDKLSRDVAEPLSREAPASDFPRPVVETVHRLCV